MWTPLFSVCNWIKLGGKLLNFDKFVAVSNSHNLTTSQVFIKSGGPPPQQFQFQWNFSKPKLHRMQREIIFTNDIICSELFFCYFWSCQKEADGSVITDDHVFTPFVNCKFFEIGAMSASFWVLQFILKFLNKIISLLVWHSLIQALKPINIIFPPHDHLFMSDI